ncbi:FUSC family protein [Janibacter corallicola]|uniref:FUSC family protein n=1 Tax=Janibacter corallicola TaxID=415212 RepID=UPI000AE39FF6|nr:FUSC family protein [Janibacter corallicola]
MSAAAVGDVVRSMTGFAPGPPRRWVATRVAVALALPLVGITLAGHPDEAFLAGLGVFAVLYGANAPVRRRLLIVPTAGLGLLLCLGVGALTAGLPALAVVGMALAATVGAVLTYTLRIGPPAGFFFALDLGIANLAVGGGADPRIVLGIPAIGVLSAIVVGTSDLWLGRHGIEEAAVTGAEGQVERYLAESDPQRLPEARIAASIALDHAWTVVAEGGSEERHGGRMQRVHNRYVSALARAVGGPDADVTGELALKEATRARQVSLGRPSSSWSLRQALRWPSEDLLVAARVLIAALLAGGIAMAIDNAHAYWAAAFAVLVVQVGGTRTAQLHRAIQRTIGTGLGLLAFALVLGLGLDHWPLVATVVALQFVVEMLVTRNYALAVIFITPLALSISAAVTRMDTTTIVLDRGIDTIIGVGCAILVVLVTGRLGRPELLLRAHARRVVHALDDLLGDLAESRTGSPEGMRRHLEHCRQLHTELVASNTVARRAVVDAPAEVAPYRGMEELLVEIGYLALGTTWNPRLRGERERMAAAREALAPVLRHRVTGRRAAEDITADLRQVRTALTTN